MAPGLGLFGKLPAKRDFVAVDISRNFLACWEPWLQAGLAASREHMADRRESIYSTAPAWRFWLGGDLCGGSAALGAFLPSFDGVGRCYPLTIVDCGDPPPPAHNEHADWYAGVESLLRLAVACELDYPLLIDRLRSLAPAAARSPAAQEDVATVDPPGPLAFARIDANGSHPLHAGMTYWWTEGCPSQPARALPCRGMPAPLAFVSMLSGDWPASPDEV